MKSGWRWFINEGMEAELQEYWDSLPAETAEFAKQYPPSALYYMAVTKHYVRIIGYDETDPLTVTVLVSCEFNALIHDRRVFGVKPSDIEPTDLPEDGKRIGCPEHGGLREFVRADYATKGGFSQ